MTNTPTFKRLEQWRVVLADGTSVTCKADEIEDDGPTLRLFIANEQVDLFAPGTWVSVHRVRREK